MSDAVLVTGAFGLVGAVTVKHLAATGRHVVATDLATRPTARPPHTCRPAYRSSGLTSPIRPSAPLWSPPRTRARSSTRRSHPATVLRQARAGPPGECRRYGKPGQSSCSAGESASIHSSLQHRGLRATQPASRHRRPHRRHPVRPYDVYGGHKIEAEAIVRKSPLDWVILRLGGCSLSISASASTPTCFISKACCPPTADCIRSTSATWRTPRGRDHCRRDRADVADRR